MFAERVVTARGSAMQRACEQDHACEGSVLRVCGTLALPGAAAAGHARGLYCTDHERARRC